MITIKDKKDFGLAVKRLQRQANISTLASILVDMVDDREAVEVLMKLAKNKGGAKLPRSTAEKWLSESLAEQPFMLTHSQLADQNEPQAPLFHKNTPTQLAA